MPFPRKSSRLESKKTKPESPSPDPSPPPPPKHVLTEAERSRLYRERRKHDPEKYAAYLEKNKAACHKYRESMTPEEKADYVKKVKERVKQSRQRIKDEQAAKASKRATRKDTADKEAQRARWREEKRQQRETMHWKTREARNARKRAAYHAKKTSSVRLPEKDDQEVSSDPQPFSTPETAECDPKSSSMDSRTAAAQRKALQRARGAMPSSPAKFVNTVGALIDSATPRRRSLFYMRGMNKEVQKIALGLIKTFKRLKNKNFAQERQVRSVLLGVIKGSTGWFASNMALMLHVGRSTIFRHKNKREKPKVRKNAAEIAVAGDFFETHAAAVPDKKLVSKKTGKEAAFLQKPLKELHKDYQTEGGRLAFSTFAKCRPHNIRLMTQTKWRQCLCEYCANVSLKLDTIRAAATSHRLFHCFIANEREAVRIITCGPREKACCYGTCPSCSAHNLEDYLQPLLQFRNDQVKWYRWENQVRHVRGKQVSRKGLVTKVGDLATLVNELKREVKFLAEHLFRADWQHLQFTNMRNATPFPAETAMMVMDFAENFTCQYQAEVQAAHWHHERVTLHPTVTYYRCPACAATTTESLVFVSDDQKHDHHAVHTFTQKAMEHLQQQRGLTISHVVQWTDAAPSQYKSKGPFSDISCALEDLHCTLERNFFGSRHGKGPSDGESAVVKHHMTTAIAVGRAVISNAEEVYLYLQQSPLNKQPPVEECSHSLRTFFWVPQGTISRDRPNRQVKTVCGTRTFHSVKCVEQGKIMSRHLTCTCHPCLSGFGDCMSLDVLGPWSEQLCKPANQVGKVQPNGSGAKSAAPVVSLGLL